MLRHLIMNGGEGISEYIIQMLLSLPIILFSLSMHETAHGFVSYKLGDPTAKNLGRLTLNPLKHLDPLGFICMLFAGFGWAKPVPIDSRYYKKPRRDIALTAAAGPVSNLILAFIFTIILRLAWKPLFEGIISNLDTTFGSFLYYIYIFIILAIQMNITLAVFNLIPIAPLDGSRIIHILIPAKWFYKIAPYERYITLGFMLLLIMGVFSPLLNTVTKFISNLMFKIVGLN